MKEIKFRGKRIDTGEWVYGSLVQCDITGKRYILPMGSDANESDKVGHEGCLMLFTFEVIPETVGQYTGLKDKNGKKIYEGDIIKSLCQVFLEDDQDALISEVYYHESYAAFYLLANNRDCENDDYEIDEPLEQFIHNYDILEVIGNIYENPELLESLQ